MPPYHFSHSLHKSNVMMPGMKDFMTRPEMRKKWGRGAERQWRSFSTDRSGAETPMISESWAGLWGAERQWRSSSTDRSGAKTAKHGTIRLASIDPNIMSFS